jgi:hypothetical protein
MSRIRSQLRELTPLVMSLLLGLMCAALSMGGCSGGLQVASVPATSPNNTITLNAFSNPVPAGSPAFTAAANGSGLTPSSSVSLDSSAHISGS